MNSFLSSMSRSYITPAGQALREMIFFCSLIFEINKDKDIVLSVA